MRLCLLSPGPGWRTPHRGERDHAQEHSAVGPTEPLNHGSELGCNINGVVKPRSTVFECVWLLRRLLWQHRLVRSFHSVTFFHPFTPVHLVHRFTLFTLSSSHPFHLFTLSQCSAFHLSPHLAFSPFHPFHTSLHPFTLSTLPPFRPVALFTFLTSSILHYPTLYSLSPIHPFPRLHLCTFDPFALSPFSHSFHPLQRFTLSPFPPFHIFRTLALFTVWASSRFRPSP